jgi:hypothetical protein
MADRSVEYLMKRIGRMRSLGWLVEWELHCAIYRAHHQGVPLAELAHTAELNADHILQIIGDVNPDELPDPEDPEVDWVCSQGGAIYGTF